MRQLAKEKITKKDPKKQLSGWLDYRSKENNPNNPKVSASLKKLQAERRHALLTRLGVIIFTSVCFILILGYFVSPKANVASVQIKGVPELNSSQIVKASGINSQDKVLGTFLKQKQYSQKLSAAFPEIESVKISTSHLNNVIFNIKEKKVIGYISEKDNHYRKILANGKVGSQTLSAKEIDKQKPIFIGYNKRASLKEDLYIYSKLPVKVQNQIKVMSGETNRPTQIIFVMNDNNVVIGNTSTIASKIKYYEKIKNQLKQPSVIDLEIGAFSRPLSNDEKNRLRIAP
nr:FtsQ-type POTRA domain-containing protein [Lactobacillus hominis]